MSDIVAQLLNALGPEVVRHSNQIGAEGRSDWSGILAEKPRAVVRVRNVDDVSLAMRLCQEAGQRVVVQGGMTGLAGGAVPNSDEVVIALDRLVGIEDIDTKGATMTLLAGTPLEQAQQAADQAGFSLGIDLGSRGSCTIGGNVATNAGGVQVIKYGMTRANTRGLEVVLADGTVVSGLNKMLKNNAGYDWSQLFIGSEGTLGIITRVVLAMQPRLPNMQTAYCMSPSFDAAVQVMHRLQVGLPGGLYAFEAMWPDYLHFAKQACGIELPIAASDDSGSDGVAIILETAANDGVPGAETALEVLLMEMIEQDLIRDAVVAKSESERQRIWAVREAPSEFPRLLPDMVAFDVSIPLAVFNETVTLMRDRLHAEWPGMTTLFYGHVGDSNLHLITHVPGWATQPRDAINAIVYGAVSQVSGSVSAEHGIGRLKVNYLPMSRSPEEIELMKRIKQALDPKSLLNSGRLWPS